MLRNQPDETEDLEKLLSQFEAELAAFKVWFEKYHDDVKRALLGED